jgi:hypothetical protein
MKDLCAFSFLAITDDQCYEENKGVLYTGKVNLTETGYPCRRWDSEEAYETMSGLANYCRAPDGATFPWCLSSAPGKRWEKCNVPICGKKKSLKKTHFMLFIYDIILLSHDSLFFL